MKMRFNLIFRSIIYYAQKIHYALGRLRTFDLMCVMEAESCLQCAELSLFMVDHSATILIRKRPLQYRKHTHLFETGAWWHRSSVATTA